MSRPLRNKINDGVIDVAEARSARGGVLARGLALNASSLSNVAIKPPATSTKQNKTKKDDLSIILSGGA